MQFCMLHRDLRAQDEGIIPPISGSYLQTRGTMLFRHKCPRLLCFKPSDPDQGEAHFLSECKTGLT